MVPNVNENIGNSSDQNIIETLPNANWNDSSINTSSDFIQLSKTSQKNPGHAAEKGTCGNDKSQIFFI